jgi:hypothetical protein
MINKYIERLILVSLLLISTIVLLYEIKVLGLSEIFGHVWPLFTFIASIVILVSVGYLLIRDIIWLMQ